MANKTKSSTLHCSSSPKPLIEYLPEGGVGKTLLGAVGLVRSLREHALLMPLVPPVALLNPLSPLPPSEERRVPTRSEGEQDMQEFRT